MSQVTSLPGWHQMFIALAECEELNPKQNPLLKYTASLVARLFIAVFISVFLPLWGLIESGAHLIQMNWKHSITSLGAALVPIPQLIFIFAPNFFIPRD